MRSVTEAEKQGFVPERKVSIDSRHWEALRRITWKMKTCWGFVASECEAMLAGCRHVDGCEGATDIDRPCKPGCPDRQTRLSALMILANAREFADQNGTKPVSAEQYMPPTREYFDGIIAELVTAQTELAELEAKIEGKALPSPKDVEKDPS